ncbi:MRG/MORF4L-binding protein isoform X1 [Marmota monax]|uniref:MRG/MORF4L-binding protein isoform X1 n=1 Tax=Marmota monax TaxID=9995 RepID=UPI001EB02959|nr:MRG/MORF4L-binding protein isoform X1 [Marmota monax]
MGEAEVGGGGAPGDKGPGEAATSPAEETVVWSPEVEVCLFHAMLGHKPVGVNRHFHMICIRDKFSQNIGRQVPSKVIWDHLSTMYDMQALGIYLRLGSQRKFPGTNWGPEKQGLSPQGAKAWAPCCCQSLGVPKVLKHESEILPFPNPERNFVLPEEIIQEVREGKVVIEEEMKEEMKEDVDPHSGADDVFSSSGSLGKSTEKSSKDKEKSSSDLGCKDGADKRKRSRVTDKVLTANSNPSSPSAAKRRRT